MTEQNKSLSLIEKLKQKAQNQQHYGGEAEEKPATLDAAACPACGAGRAKQDGVTHCAYCGFRFIHTQLSDGIFIKKEDNSK